MSSRYEPGPTGNYGSSGLAREGMEERYSTALWRDNPSAFWLHPDGPLADTTPAEFFVPEPPPPPPGPLSPYAGYANVYYPAYALQQAAGYQSGLQQLQGPPTLGLFGFRLF
jgi:hypothetical protein